MIPAAVGAVAALVNFPNGCDVDEARRRLRTAAQNLDADGTDDDVVRVRFTKAEFEGDLGAGTRRPRSWDDVFPELARSAAATSRSSASSASTTSGTTFAFKDYLDTIDSGEGWLTTYATSANNTRDWPRRRG